MCAQGDVNSYSVNSKNIYLRDFKGEKVSIENQGTGDSTYYVDSTNKKNIEIKDKSGRSDELRIFLKPGEDYSVSGGKNSSGSYIDSVSIWEDPSNPKLNVSCKGIENLKVYQVDESGKVNDKPIFESSKPQFPWK